MLDRSNLNRNDYLKLGKLVRQHPHIKTVMYDDVVKIAEALLAKDEMFDLAVSLGVNPRNLLKTDDEIIREIQCSTSAPTI